MSVKLLLNRKYFNFHFSNVFTTEMDVDNGSPHIKAAITYSTKKEVISSLQSFVLLNPEYTFRVYETRGGIRVFCVSHLISHSSEKANSLQASLKGDPLFWKNVITKEGYCARVSKKPQHGNSDYVSKYLTTIGTAPIDNNCLKVTQTYEFLISIGRKLPVVNKQHLRSLVAILGF